MQFIINKTNNKPNLKSSRAFEHFDPFKSSPGSATVVSQLAACFHPWSASCCHLYIASAPQLVTVIVATPVLKATIMSAGQSKSSRTVWQQCMSRNYGICRVSYTTLGKGIPLPTLVPPPPQESWPRKLIF